MKNMPIVRSLFAKVFATAAVLTAAMSASAQAGAPPILVQVPFTSLIAGGASANCAGAFTVNTYSFGDGCPATQIKLTSGTATIYSTAVDRWGNVYYATLPATPGSGIVQVIYAGTVTVNGVANPATAMIEAANPGATSPVQGSVYTVAGSNGTSSASSAPASGSPCSSGSSANSLSSSGSGCPGTIGYIKKAYGVAVDGDGNLFILDESNSNIYVLIANASSLGAQLATLEYAHASTPTTITPAVGSIYLVAGAGGGYSDGGYAIAGKVHNPYGIAVDGNDNLYIADYTNDAVRMINGPDTTTAFGSSTTPGYIHTIGGNCTSSACTALSTTPTSNTAAVGADFLDPAGIAVDAYGNVYVADNVNSKSATVPATVRVIYAGGTINPLASLINIETGYGSPIQGDVYTIAGDTVAGGNSALGNGLLATNSGVSFDQPYGLAVDKLGNIYIADYSSKGLVVKLDASNGYLYDIQGGQLATLGAGNYCNGGTIGPTMTDAYGDGCPATQSGANHIYGNPSFDAEGNLYFADSGDGLIRKLTFSSFPATSVGSTAATQSLAFTLLTGSTSETASNVAATVTTQGTANSEFADVTASDTCTGSTILTGYASTSASVTTSSTAAYTCVVPVAFTPANPGSRMGALTLSATVNSAAITTTAFISGIGNGPGLVIDPGVGEGTFGVASETSPQGVADDAAGNVYVAWANGDYSEIPSSGAATTITGALSQPHQVAVDGAGNAYIANTGGNSITEIVAGATAANANFVTAALGETLSAPQGVAVDGSGNLYIADTGNARVLFVPQGGGYASTLGSGWESPVSVAVDSSNNVYVADSSLDEIIKITPAGAQTVLASSVNPVSLTVDAAGDVVYADSSLSELIELPVNGVSDELGGFVTPLGVAFDPKGNVYVAYGYPAVAYLSRSTSAAQDVSNSSLTATVTNNGNQAYSGALSQSGNTSDFTIGGATTNGCASTTTLSLAPGESCGYTGALDLMNVTAPGPYVDTVTLAGNAVNNASMTMNFSATVNSITTTTLLTGPTGTVAAGSSITLTATVSASGDTPTGTVNFMDGSTTLGTATLSAGVASYTVSSATAGTHNYSAVYAGTSLFQTSTSSSFSITVATIPSTTTTLSSSATTTSPTYGQSVSVTASVTNTSGSGGTPTGNITFSVDGTSQSTVSLDSSGAYTLTLTGLAAGSHSVSASYAGTSGFAASSTATPLTFTVAPLAISATATPVSSIYGQAIPTISGTLSGVLSQDTANVTAVFSTTATATSPVGTYPISVSLIGSAAANYTATVTGSPTVTINQATVTLAIASASKIYGAAIPTLTGSLTGVLAADAANVTANYSTTATATSTVGTYPITASVLSGSASNNYHLGAVTSGTLTVSPLAITDTVNPNPVSAILGQPIPAITGTLNGVLAQDVGNVSAVFATTATASSPVGTYPISISLTGSAAFNYTVTLSTPASVIIANATVAVVVTNATRAYGAANPTFTATLTGVQPQDAANVAAVLSTTATATSSVGTYSITATALTGSAAASYTLGAVTKGTLTVTTAPTTTTLIASTASVGSGNSITFTATVASTTTGTPTGSVTFSSGSTSLGTATLSGGVANYTTGSLPTGAQSITATYSGSTNFSSSTSASVGENVTVPIVTGTASSSSVNISSGGTATVTLGFTAQGGYTGLATYSCALLPANMTCSFSPASVTFTSTSTTANTTLTISTSGAGGSSSTASLERRSRPGSGKTPLAALAGIFAGLCMLGRSRRRLSRYIALLVLLLAGMAGIGGLTGCGGSASSSTNHTSTGTYNILVEITAGTVQSVPLTVTVQ